MPVTLTETSTTTYIDFKKWSYLINGLPRKFYYRVRTSLNSNTSFQSFCFLFLKVSLDSLFFILYIIVSVLFKSFSKFEFSPKLDSHLTLSALHAEANLIRPHVLASLSWRSLLLNEEQTSSNFYVSKLSWLSKFNGFNFLHQSAVDSKYILSFYYFPEYSHIVNSYRLAGCDAFSLLTTKILS